MKHRFYTAVAAFALTSCLALVQPSFAQTAAGTTTGGAPAGATNTGGGNPQGVQGGGHHKNGDGSGGHHEDHEACKRILEACKQHGFIKGQWKKDNGLYKDCFDPIVNGGGVTQDGKSVSVPVSQGDVQACREHKEHEKEHKEHKQGSGAGTGSGITPQKNK